MPSRPQLNIEHLLYAAILLVAIALRFGNLGGFPLTELEARVALPAHQMSQGVNVEFAGDQPGYSVLALLTFFILPSSEFLARWWPALAGCALVALPFFWRDLLGRKAALLLSLALALDPGFVAVSRLASGRMLAVLGFATALTAWHYRRWTLAGIFSGFALLAAPTIYFGLIGSILVLLLFFQNRLRFENGALRSASFAAAVVAVAGGTLFFSAPFGLGGLGFVAGSFIDGVAVQGAPISQVLFAFAFYGLPALVFGLIAIVRAWRAGDALGQILSLAALLNLVIILLYPGRQVADLLWILLPLWSLAAMELSRYFEIPQDEPRAAWGEAALMLILIAFFVLSLAKVALNESVPDVSRPYLLVAGGVGLLAIVATVLIGFGWSGRSAANGLVWALALFSLFAMLSDSTRFQRSSPLAANELWTPGPAAGDLGPLTKTLQDLSYWQAGEPRDITVDLRVDSAALSWLLRNFPQHSGALTAPSLIITLASEEPVEADTYRGQSFALYSTPGWAVPPNVVGWLLYRSSPVLRQQAILWVSLNAFPDGSASLQQTEAPQ